MALPCDARPTRWTDLALVIPSHDFIHRSEPLPQRSNRILSVHLETGGMMRPTVDVNPVNLSGTAPKHFYDILDKLTDCTYEHAPATSSVNANKTALLQKGRRASRPGTVAGLREHYK
jgi:hypothetical protein